MSAKPVTGWDTVFFGGDRVTVDDDNLIAMVLVVATAHPYHCPGEWTYFLLVDGRRFDEPFEGRRLTLVHRAL